MSKQSMSNPSTPNQSSKSGLDNIRIVMINTFHPGNVGAAARAMKNMGLSQLYLVEPKDYPSEEAVSRAAGAVDILDQAVIVSSLQEAIADCSLVVGTSARSRSLPWPMMDAKECAEKACSEAQQSPVAIVFGRERMGLHNDELRQCNFHLSIPANPEYPVLNVSAAIQLVCYEIYQESQRQIQQQYTAQEDAEPYPRKDEMDLFYTHLEESLKDIDFIIEQHEGKVMTKLQRLFNRARPEQTELNMLRGVLSAVQRSAKKQD